MNLVIFSKMQIKSEKKSKIFHNFTTEKSNKPLRFSEKGKRGFFQGIKKRRSFLASAYKTWGRERGLEVAYALLRLCSAAAGESALS